MYAIICIRQRVYSRYRSYSNIEYDKHLVESVKVFHKYILATQLLGDENLYTRTSGHTNSYIL